MQSVKVKATDLRSDHGRPNAGEFWVENPFQMAESGANLSAFEPNRLFLNAGGLKFVEAGAQGEHKLARGYVPITTYSIHHIPNASFRRAVAHYLENERHYVAENVDILSHHTPFKRRGN